MSNKLTINEEILIKSIKILINQNKISIALKISFN